jgi:hypothetical protein
LGREEDAMDFLLAAAGPEESFAEAMRRTAESAYSYPFQFDSFLVGLMWGVWVVLNLWIWQKTKALSNMLMLCGSAALALFYIVHAFTWRGPGTWLVLVGTGALSVGFFMSVRPLVEAQLNALRSKLGPKGGSGSSGGGSAPPAS